MGTSLAAMVEVRETGTRISWYPRVPIWRSMVIIWDKGRRGNGTLIVTPDRCHGVKTARALGSSFRLVIFFFGVGFLLPSSRSGRK